MKFTEIPRRSAKQILLWLERNGHPLRYARLKRALKRVEFPHNVLFICHGNICRSPYAAGAFARSLPDYARQTTHIDSAGFIGPGRPTPEEGISVAARLGVDLSTHVSKSLDANMANTADLIVVMDGRQAAAVRRIYNVTPQKIVVLGDADPQPIERRAIYDPVGQNEEKFELSYRRIDRCIATLMSVFTLR